MANGFDAIFETMGAINDELTVLTARVTSMEHGGGPASGSPAGSQDGRPLGAPVVWSRVPEGDRDTLWEEFIGWVCWVADTYELTPDQLPWDCWWRHGAAVEELTALWTAYQSAYLTTEDAGSATYLWQDAMYRCVERLRIWLGGCTNGYHSPKTRYPFSGNAEYQATLLKVVGGGPAADPGKGADAEAG